MKTVVLPNSEFVLEANVFDNCNSLAKVTFNTNTYITNNLGNVFAGCASLEKFDVNTGNSYYVADNNLLLNKTRKPYFISF